MTFGLPTDAKVVTFRPDPGSPYGSVTMSWERETRETPITEEAAKKVAEGWKAEFVVEGSW